MKKQRKQGCDHCKSELFKFNFDLLTLTRLINFIVKFIVSINVSFLWLVI